VHSPASKPETEVFSGEQTAQRPCLPARRSPWRPAPTGEVGNELKCFSIVSSSLPWGTPVSWRSVCHADKPASRNRLPLERGSLASLRREQRRG